MASTRVTRSDLGRLGVAVRLATEDPEAMTAAARQRANWDRYYEQTDQALPHEERVRRALALRNAHMARMRMARAAAAARRAQ